VARRRYRHHGMPGVSASLENGVAAIGTRDADLTKQGHMEKTDEMPERFFRYVPTERVAAWQQAGWRVIGQLARAPDAARDVAIMEWIGSTEPIPPDDEVQ